MINIGELIFDSDFCTEFKILRQVGGKWENRRWIGGESKKIKVTGIVTAVNSKDIEMLPDGDRVHGLKTFYTDQELRLTDQEATSDICEYQDKQYRLLQVFNYSNNGYYKAIGTLIGGI